MKHFGAAYCCLIAHNALKPTIESVVAVKDACCVNGQVHFGTMISDCLVFVVLVHLLTMLV